MHARRVDFKSHGAGAALGITQPHEIILSRETRHTGQVAVHSISRSAAIDPQPGRIIRPAGRTGSIPDDVGASLGEFQMVYQLAGRLGAPCTVG